MAKAASSIEVLPQTHIRLQKIAREDNRTIGEVITLLIDKYEKEQFWRGISEDLEKFKADKGAICQRGAAAHRGSRW